MGFQLCIMRKLFLGSIGMDNFFDIDSHMEFLFLYGGIDLPDDRLGVKEAQNIQGGIWREVSERQKSDLPIYCLIDLFHLCLYRQ